MPPCLDVAKDVGYCPRLLDVITGRRVFFSSQVLLGCCVGADVFSAHCYLSVISAFPVSHEMSNEEG